MYEESHCVLFPQQVHNVRLSESYRTYWWPQAERWELCTIKNKQVRVSRKALKELRSSFKAKWQLSSSEPEVGSVGSCETQQWQRAQSVARYSDSEHERSVPVQMSSGCPSFMWLSAGAGGWRSFLEWIFWWVFVRNRSFVIVKKSVKKLLIVR